MQHFETDLAGCRFSCGFDFPFFISWDYGTYDRRLDMARFAKLKK